MSAAPAPGWTLPTRVFVGILGARVALYSVMFLVRAVPSAERALGGVQLALFTLGTIVGPLWLHRAWMRVPPPCRMTYDGRRIAPDEAVWKLFIPLYGFYWAFLANVGLCGAVEKHLLRTGERKLEAPSSYAFAACLTQIVPVVNLVVSPFLWALFMVRLDAVQAEAERRDHDPPPAPASLVRSLAIVVGSTLLQWVVLIVIFVAVWQFLSPAAR